jgi:soluble lytic murein transglycosylase-like protein
MYPEYAKNGELNVEQIQKEVKADEVLLKALTDVKDGHATAEETMTMNMALQTKQRIQMIKDQISSYQKLVDAIVASAEADGGTMTGARSKVYEDTSGKIADLQSQLDSLMGTYDGQIKRLADTQDATDKNTYVVDKYKNAIDELNASLEHLKSIQQQYPKYSEEYRNALKQENNLIQQQIDLTKAQAASLKKQIDSGVIQQTGMINASKSSSVSSGTSTTGSYSGQYADYINQAAAQYGVDPNLVAAIIKQESGFTQTRNGKTLSSSAGALGLMQLMPGTAKSLGVNPNDAYQNILGGTKYIAQLLKSFGGDLTKAVAAYNAGPGNVQKYGGIPPFTETQKYVKAVLANYASYGGSSSTSTTSTTSTGTVGNTAAEQAQSIDQAKSQLLQYYQTIDQLTGTLKDNNLEIVNTYVAQFDHIKSQIESQITQYDYLQNVQDKNSTAWMQTQINRESAYQQQIKTEQDSIDFIKQQIAYNNQLTQAQKDTLSDDVLQRQQEVLSIEQKLFDTRSQMADEIVSTYKQALQDMKDASTKSIDDMINTINKEADKADYKKKLSDAQKSAQDIQDEINKLMLDDSTAAKKRIADLQKQLSDQNDSITQMVSDNNKQLQIDNLNAQKDAISTYYDNMMNDEQKFAQMRNDILNINNQSIVDSLKSLSTQVQANVNLLGTSVVNTLIDAINRANGYLNLSTTNAGSIGHIASLDTGGITPKFSGGKLAVLHQDEMISNKVDTSNFLKSINLVKDMVSNIFNPSNLSGVLSPATAGGNTYQVYFNVDKMTGNQNDVNNFVTKFVNGIKAKGGVI